MTQAERIAKLIPDPYVLVMGIIVLSALATYVVPAGQYERKTVDGTETVVPGSYHQIEHKPVSWTEILMSVQKGLIDAASIIFFLLLIGGSLGVITSTGAVEVFLAYIVEKAQITGNEYLVLIIVPLMFSFLGAVIGTFEEGIAFVPLLVILSIELGYDAIVGCSLVLLGTTAGFTSAPLNPFTVGIAQGIAELPLYSGMWYRWTFWGISTAITIAYIYRYASKVKNDPSQSLVSNVNYDRFHFDKELTEMEFERSHIRVLLIFLIAIGVLVIGVVQFGWYINEIATLFLATGFIIGIAYGMKSDEIINNFIDGAKDLVYAALIVGFARGILVVLREGAIFDTVVYSLIQPLQQLSPVVAASLMVPVMSVIDFFVPSGSGQAAVVIPILAPIADVLEIPRQVIILAFQYGDGFSNMFVPTSGGTMAMIAAAEIPYGQWLIYVSKLLIIQLAVGIIAVGIAVIINLGPT